MLIWIRNIFVVLILTITLVACVGWDLFWFNFGYLVN